MLMLCFYIAAAELAIRHLKERLSIALSLNKKGDNSWLQHLESTLNGMNSKFVKNTNIRRDAVTKFNVHKVLAQKYRVADWSPLVNTSVITNFSKPMLKALRFPYQVGQRVLISRSSNYTVRSDQFTKKSVEGSFTKKTYVIEDVFLKTNANHFYSICFKLKSIKGLFYSGDLIESFADTTGDQVDEDAADRKLKLAKLKKKRAKT
jgi:hypothetical protein